MFAETDFCNSTFLCLVSICSIDVSEVAQGKSNDSTEIEAKNKNYP